MSLVIPPGYVSAAFVISEAQTTDLGTEPFIWTLGLDASSATSPVDLANSLMGMWQDVWAPITGQAFQLERVELTMAAVGGGTGVAVSTEEPVQGLQSQDPTYVAFAPKVRKQTSLVGRRYKGVFHPPGVLSISEVDSNGTIVPLQRIDIQGAADDMVGALTTLGTVAVLLHSSEAIAPTPITGFVVAPKVGVLRNRMV